MKTALAVTNTEVVWIPRWIMGLFAAIFYIEMCAIVVLRIHLPVPPDPVFKKPPDPMDYHWERGPYDDDTDGCDYDYGVCWSVII